MDNLIEIVTGISRDFAEIERLRREGNALVAKIAEIDGYITDLTDQKAALQATLDTNAAWVAEAAKRVEKFVRGGAAAQTVEPKKMRGKKAPEPVEVNEKHPCHLCEDVFYNKPALVAHLRSEHKVSLEEAVKAANPLMVGSYSLDGAGDTPLTDDPPELPLCATCIGPCNKFEDHSFEQAYHCGGFTTEPDEDQVKWRDSTCAEWRECQFQNKCFGPANEYDPTCFKEDEIRRRGEASLAAESKALAPLKPDTEARRAQLIEEKARRDSLCGEWLGCDRHKECFDSSSALHVCLKKNTCCEKCYGEGMYIEDDIEDGGGELYCSCPAGVALKEKDEAALPAEESDADVIARHEPAEAILPRGEFRAEDLPKGKKKQLVLLEENRKAVADLVARRIDLFKRGSAAVSDYDKGMGYDLDYNLTQNKTQLSYALSQFNGLDRLLNPTSEQETNHEAATQEAGPESVEKEQEGAGADVSRGAAQQFLPLDEPLGNCELCMGYGVIEGELYGESTLVPCTCEAGLKVKGQGKQIAESLTPIIEGIGQVIENLEKLTPQCCEDCNIEDPDCASCHLPDMDAPFEVETAPPPAGEGELPRCANGSCTATGKDAKDVCLRIGQLGRAPQECKNFVPVENCSHHMLKRSAAPDGSTVCDLCGFVLRPAPKAEPEKCGNARCNMYGLTFNSNCRAIEDLLQTSGEQRQASACNDYKPINLANSEPEKPALTPMQQKCTHPKVFRELTEAGEICKVCKLNLTQPALF